MFIPEPRVKNNTEVEVNVYLPNDEHQLNEMAGNPNPERLPVILEENETAELDNEEISTPIRGDNSSQTRPTEAEELPAPVTTRRKNYRVWRDKRHGTPERQRVIERGPGSGERQINWISNPKVTNERDCVGKWQVAPPLAVYRHMNSS